MLYRGSTGQSLHIRPTTEADLEPFRELRLEALRAHPEAFGSDFDESRQRPREHWIERMRNTERQMTLVATATNATLAAMAGIFRDEGAKVRHSASIWGVYVRPAWRGAGLAGALVNACVDWAREAGVRIVRLSVVTSNESAIRCYRRCGFEQYGLAPEVIFADGKYQDEILMFRKLEEPLR
jgi:RimJ/RimL family protein N-acetyltransferase